jgi:hypothetical protein
MGGNMTNAQVGFILAMWRFPDKPPEEIYKYAETFARLMNQIDSKLFKEYMGIKDEK